MITGFEFSTIKAWSDESGLLVRRNLRRESKPKKSAVRNWNVIFSKAASGGLVVGSLLLSSTASAVAIPTLPNDMRALKVAGSKLSQSDVLSPTRQINQSFNNFFDSVRTGQQLIPSDHVRLLAKKAVQSQKESVDIDSWARKLANDIRVAND